MISHLKFFVSEVFEIQSIFLMLIEQRVAVMFLETSQFLGIGKMGVIYSSSSQTSQPILLPFFVLLRFVEKSSLWKLCLLLLVRLSFLGNSSFLNMPRY